MTQETVVILQHCSVLRMLVLFKMQVPFVLIDLQNNYTPSLTVRTKITPVPTKYFDTDSCLYSLLFPPRPPAVTSRLRSSQTFPKVDTRTHRYCSFIQLGLNHCQHKNNKPYLFYHCLWSFWFRYLLVSLP